MRFGKWRWTQWRLQSLMRLNSRWQLWQHMPMQPCVGLRPVTDHARLLRIRSDNIQQTSNVLVTIEDSGMGIEKKDKDRIFEPFFTTKSTGTGIGLAICRSIVEAHGGSLRASENDPHGTIFYVALPTDFTAATEGQKRQLTEGMSPVGMEPT